MTFILERVLFDKKKGIQTNAIYENGGRNNKIVGITIRSD